MSRDGDKKYFKLAFYYFGIVIVDLKQFWLIALLKYYIPECNSRNLTITVICINQHITNWYQKLNLIRKYITYSIVLKHKPRKI